MADSEGKSGYDTFMLRIEFEGEEIPWLYPLALNGRVIKAMFADGEPVERVRERAPEWDGQWFRCGACGERLDRFGVRTTQMLDGTTVRRIAEPPKRCPECGARVKESGDD